MQKILIVDDDKSILEALGTAAELEGYEVLCVSKGSKVIDQAMTFLPDLIILDVLLEDGDGRVICQELKARKGTLKIPIIMISAYSSAEKSSRESGADDFIAKPFDLSLFFAKVSEFLK